MAPLDIRLLDGRRTLALTWDDGAVTTLSAAALRRHSRAAQAIRAALDGRSAETDAALQLSEIRLVGHYALQLVFSDGHDRGLYPWSLLRELGRPEG